MIIYKYPLRLRNVIGQTTEESNFIRLARRKERRPAVNYYRSEIGISERDTKKK